MTGLTDDTSSFDAFDAGSARKGRTVDSALLRAATTSF